ncbi:MAG: phosphate ABC transporter permease family protein, partial [Acidobacteria bacterium]|nr:phosphate ABC transporter permease family protein [Acidobacteriota bacterium]
MHGLIQLLVLLVFAGFAYRFGRRYALSLVDRPTQLNSLPGYYGSFLILWGVVPSILVLALWLAIEPKINDSLLVDSLPAAVQSLPEDRLALYVNDVKNLASGNIVSREADPELKAAAAHYLHLEERGAMGRWGLLLALTAAGMLLGRRMITPQLRAMVRVERAFSIVLLACSTIAILTTLGIVLSLLFESLRFFQRYPLTDFLFGLEWSPQTALRPDQVGSSGSFGAVPLFAGTLLISAIAMLVAVPVGLLSAIYMAEYAPPKARTVLKPLLEILAGIPTVVYGFFAAL